MKKIFLIVAVLSLVLIFNITAARAQESIVWEDFEGDFRWVPVNWENVGAVNLTVVSENASEGEKALKVDMEEEEIEWKNKVAFSKEDYLNLDGVNLIMDVYNPYDSGIAVAVAFDTGTGWEYFEAPSQRVKMGWNKDVTFYLDTRDFKCRGSNWEHTELLANKDDVRKVHIMVYRPAKMETQTIYIDNIRFE